MYEVVLFPDLAGAITGAATRDDAETEAADCRGSWPAAAMANHEPIPEPSGVKRSQRLAAVPLWIAPEAGSCRAMESSGVSNSELARRLGVRETVVLRMLDPDHATKSVNMEWALQVVGSVFFWRWRVEGATRTEEVTRTPIHPGGRLREELETVKMSAAESSRQFGVPADR